MKVVLLVLIRLYWTLIPKSQRRPCLFRETCSRHVYRVTSKHGLLKGIAALRSRFRRCRPGYQVIIDEHDQLQLITKDGSIINGQEISLSVVNQQRHLFNQLNALE